MTLAQRLISSLSILVILSTSALGWFVHQSWRQAEESQFEAEFARAKDRLATQLDTELNELPKLLEPLCQHSQMVDDPLTSLQAGPIPADRRHALSLLTTGTQRAYRFDEFVLFTSKGEILGAHQVSLVGAKDPALAMLSGTEARGQFVVEQGVPKIRAHCQKTVNGVSVGLLAAKHLGKLLEQVGALHGLTLSLVPPEVTPRYLARLDLPILSGVAVYASPQKSWLDEAVQKSTRAILLWGAITLVGTLIVGWWFARRLAVPIESLAEQVQQAMEGEPQKVRARGAPEVVRFAEAFNRAIDDLSSLRKRLAVTERIAAQREIARRVAHEIKNPLAPIRAAIETLRRLRRRDDPKFDSYFDEATETVLSEVKRITTIVNEFTEFARMPQPNPKDIDLNEVLEYVVGLHRDEVVRLEVTGGKDLPSLRADRDQLVQVFTNLVQNALDAVKGQPDALVRLHVLAKDGRIEVQVRDNGPGIPAALRSKLFQPYVTGKEHGTGLGLSIAQTIVAEHGGTIESIDTAGQGACFRIRLPVSGPVVARESQPPKQEP